MNALCLLCKYPNKIWCDFLNKFKKFKIFIIIDDNSEKYNEYRLKYINITFIQIDSDLCTHFGFYNSATEVRGNMMPSKSISWDKALLNFCWNNDYDNVWFLEDDVYFYNESTLYNLDRKYKNVDFICCEEFNQEKKKYNINDWHWWCMDVPQEYIEYSRYLLVCCVRLSKKFLNVLKKHVQIYRKLYLIEALFPTLVNKYNLNYVVDEKLWITFNSKLYPYKKRYIYHPIKNINEHLEFRNKFKKN